MKKISIALFITLILTACTTVQSSMRISSDLKAQDFNDLTSQYMNRPTFAKVENMSDGATVLVIEMDGYKKPDYGLQYFSVRFLKENSDKYINLIDKYEEWQKKATTRDDAFSKEIGRAPTWGNGGNVDLRFQFHSGNSQSHYLQIDQCAMGTCVSSGITFNQSNAIKLKELLNKFKNDSIKQSDIENIYQ